MNTNPAELRLCKHPFTIGLFYDLLFDMAHAQHEMVKVEFQLAIEIGECDPNDSLFHVEDTGEDEYMEVWRANAWRESLPRRMEIKRQSGERVRMSHLKSDCIKKLARQIRRRLGLEKDDSISLATTMIQKKDKKRIELLGVDITTEEWKEMLS